MEYLRIDEYQYVDKELCMILDAVTGKPAREYTGDAILSLEDALKILNQKLPQYVNRERLVIIKLASISAYKIE